MATRKAPKKTVKRVIKETPQIETNFPVLPVEQKERKPISCKKAIGISILGILVVLGFFWYRTNTWPIAAIVNGKFISRYTLYKNLYQQGGKTVLDNLITEQLVRSELDKEKITVSAKEVDAKIDEIKKQLPAGSDLNSLLAARGMTEKDLQNQIELQLRIEKAAGNKVTVRTEEVDKYIADNESYLTGSSSAEKRANAEELIKNQKSQEEITNWIEQIRKQAKVWTPDNSWIPTEVAQ